MEHIELANSEALENIKSKIYEIRGVKVMLDFDLAKLYGVETKNLNKAVHRNIERFPDDFMFRLNRDECLRFQIGTLNGGRGQHIKYMPYAFTEMGVAMLSSVLRSKTAINVNISIMRAFVMIKNIIYSQEVNHSRFNKLEQDMQSLKEYIEEVFTDYNDINEDTRTQLELINITLAELQNKIKEKEPEPKPRNPIGFRKLQK